jgi:hypothetical protein
MFTGALSLSGDFFKESLNRGGQFVSKEGVDDHEVAFQTDNISEIP